MHNRGLREGRKRAPGGALGRLLEQGEELEADLRLVDRLIRGETRREIRWP